MSACPTGGISLTANGSDQGTPIHRFKKSGEFDRLRRELLAQFRSGVSYRLKCLCEEPQPNVSLTGRNGHIHGPSG